MKYIGSQDLEHKQAPRVGVLITNLGTPEKPEKKALRAYLREFLSDPRVVEVPRLLWWFILNGVILNFRPARSAASYRTVWTDRGSPLLYHTSDQADALQERLAQQFDNEVCVRFAMRYGAPSVARVAQEMLDEGVDRLLMLPLYPQYCGATTGSTFDALAADFTRRRALPQLRFVTEYHQHPAYINALAESVRAHRAAHGEVDRLIFSYHGVPQRYRDEGDPYYRQCLATSAAVALELGLDESSCLTTFQSRFGREPWLQPYTDETLKALPAQGVRSVQIICPGFAADCLETLEEIGVENREYFMAAGGEQFQYIPCLNSCALHIEALASIAGTELAGWLE